MQVRCIRDFGGLAVGDVAEVPDGSQVDPAHWEVIPPGGEAEPAAGGEIAARVTASSGQPTVPPVAVEAAKELLDGLAARVTAPREEGM